MVKAITKDAFGSPAMLFELKRLELVQPLSSAKGPAQGQSQQCE